MYSLGGAAPLAEQVAPTCRGTEAMPEGVAPMDAEPQTMLFRMHSTGHAAIRN